MTTKDQQEFKKLVVEAMSSDGGKNAIVDAIHSSEGQKAIKRGTVAALKIVPVLKNYEEKVGVQI